MREIKFRAWDKKRNCWNYTLFELDADGEMIQADWFEMCQYTGLKDRNGKEIYEGDIVRWDDGSNGKYWRVAEVFWDDSEALFSYRLIRCINCILPDDQVFGGNFMYRDGSQLEVTGNIYENS